MGMDLITIGFTTGPRGISSEHAHQYLKALSPEALKTMYETAEMGEFVDDVEGYLATVLDGADVAQEIDSLRMSTCYPIPGTASTLPDSIEGDWIFWIAGGGSWGDDPFDGFTPLNAFVEACHIDKSLALVCGFIGGGIRTKWEE